MSQQYVLNSLTTKIQKALAEVDKYRNSIWQDGLNNNNSYQLVVSRETADQLGWIQRKIDDFKRIEGEVDDEKFLDHLRHLLIWTIDTLCQGPSVSSSSPFENAIQLAKFDATRETKRTLENWIARFL